MKLRFIPILTAVAFFAACAHVDITKTSKGFYDPTNPNDVQILKTRPDQSYEELGTVTVTGFAPTEAAKMHNAVREKAAALGADAVILTEEGMIQSGFGGMQRWATGVAIKFKKTVPPSPAPSPN